MKKIIQGDLEVTGQVYAKNTYNEIDANDIVNNTLTQEQYDLITNGKPTLIKGVLLNRENLLILSWVNFDENTDICETFGKSYNSTYTVFQFLMINKTTKVVSFAGPQSYKRINIQNLAEINGKGFPNYPNSPTIPQSLIFDTDNTLKYINTHYEWYGTQAEYDALGTYDSNTIYNILES